MNRQEIIGLVLDMVDDDTIIVSNIADTSFELCMLRDRPKNFYMLGSFGLAPSIALGIAISRKERVIAIDGDGALLYNMGCLATEGRYGPPNFLHVIVDNGAHGATGYQPTATSCSTDISGVATACGLQSRQVNDCDSMRVALAEALGIQGPRVIVAKVDEKPPSRAPIPPYDGSKIRERFMAALNK